MKKILGLVLIAMVGVSHQACFGLSSINETIKNVTGIDTVLLTPQVMKLALSVPVFINKVQTVFPKFRDDFRKMKDLSGAAKDAEIKRLFVLGVSMLVDVNNISDNIMGLVKVLVPAIKKVDPTNGDKAEQAINNVMNIIFKMTQLSTGVQRMIITDSKGVLEKPKDQGAMATPVTVPAADL